MPRLAATPRCLSVIRSGPAVYPSCRWRGGKEDLDRRRLQCPSKRCPASLICPEGRPARSRCSYCRALLALSSLTPLCSLSPKHATVVQQLCGRGETGRVPAATNARDEEAWSARRRAAEDAPGAEIWRGCCEEGRLRDPHLALESV